MRRNLSLLTMSLLFCTTVQGWGGKYRDAIESQRMQEQAKPQNFPYSPTQEWFLDENYLLWKPYLTDFEYGVKTFNEGTLYDRITNMKIKRPEFDWSSGVRMGLGKYLPHHDAWDVSAYMTYLYASKDGKTSANQDDRQSLNETNFAYLSDGFDEISAHWRMNYFVWDLMLGREFLVKPTIIFHPYIGLRAALIDQKYKVGGSGIQLGGKGNTQINSSFGYSYKDDFWAVGLRIGNRLTFSFARHWAFLGNVAGSLLFGHDHVKLTGVASRQFPQNFSETFTNPGKEHVGGIRTNLEGYLGLGWEKWFRKETVRVAPALLFEGSLWFNMNQIFDPTITFSQTRGNLGFMGLSFNLIIDF